MQRSRLINQDRAIQLVAYELYVARKRLACIFGLLLNHHSTSVELLFQCQQGSLDFPFLSQLLVLAPTAKGWASTAGVPGLWVQQCFQDAYASLRKKNRSWTLQAAHTAWLLFLLHVQWQQEGCYLHSVPSKEEGSITVHAACTTREGARPHKIQPWQIKELGFQHGIPDRDGMGRGRKQAVYMVVGSWSSLTTHMTRGPGWRGKAA